MNILYSTEGMASRQNASEKEQVLHHIEEQKIVGRAELYRQHFVTQIDKVSAPAFFIEQVNGYGVKVFAQTSSFAQK